MAIDLSNATSPKDFYNRSVASQPTNLASLAAGMAGGPATTWIFSAILATAAPLTVVLIVGFGLGLVAQYVMVSNGYDKDIENYLKRW